MLIDYIKNLLIFIPLLFSGRLFETKLLIEKARTEFGIEDILFTNEPENIASRQMCEKLGAELTDIEEHCHYWLKK